MPANSRWDLIQPLKGCVEVKKEWSSNTRPLVLSDVHRNIFTVHLSNGLKFATYQNLLALRKIRSSVFGLFHFHFFCV